MKILICDDDKFYLDLLKAHVSEYMKNRYLPFQIIATIDPLEVLKGQENFDLAFLDIQME